MKMTLHALLALTLVSCGGSSNIETSGEIQTLNFSETKYNEDLLGKFAIPKMESAIANLEKIQSKTSNCAENFTTEDLKADWKKATFSYQTLRPVEISLLDRNPEASLKLSERYLGGPNSAGSCTLQANTAQQIFLDGTLVDDPALNSLEFLIFSDLKSKNFCGGAVKATVDNWLSTDQKTEDLCRHINFISTTAVNQLTKINQANKKLFEEGETDQIFANSNLQAVYDNISVFIDQILKDRTLGYPLGLSKDCPWDGATCPTAIEHRSSKITFETVAKNLEGIMAVYNSTSSVTPTPQQKGLYQFLMANQKNEVANAFYNKIVEAHGLATSLKGQSLEAIAASLNGAENKIRCLDTTLENQIVPACALFVSIKDLSDMVKKDLRLALEVSKTKQIEGDSD